MTKPSMILVAPLALALVACGTSEPESVGSVGLEMRAAPEADAESGANTDLLITDAAETEYVIESAQLNLRHIELDLPDGMRCEDLAEQPSGATCEAGEDKIRIEGPIVVDLVTGETRPSLEDVLIPAGVYDRIDFRVDDGDPDDGVVNSGDALDDRSFAVTARFLYDGEPTTLELSLRFNEDIRIEQPGGVEVEAGQDLVARWITQSWLGGVDVADCIDDGDIPHSGDTVTIDDETTEGTCSDIENTIKDNMKKSGQLGGA